MLLSSRVWPSLILSCVILPWAFNLTNKYQFLKNTTKFLNIFSSTVVCTCDLYVSLPKVLANYVVFVGFHFLETNSSCCLESEKMN